MAKARKKLTVPKFVSRKQDGSKLTMLTAYTYTQAQLVDEAGVDLVLVGDSAANVILGHDTTLPVTMDQMLLFTGAVRRGVQRALVIGDMPF